MISTLSVNSTVIAKQPTNLKWWLCLKNEKVILILILYLVDADSSVHRRRRATSPCTQSKPVPVCTLLLVADYRYYRDMGGSNLQRTTSYIVGFSFIFIFTHESSYCFQHILAIAILSVCPSVCHTGGSVKNGAS